MARKAKPTDEETPKADNLNGELIQADTAAGDQVAAQLAVVDAQFGGGEYAITVYNRERVLTETRFFLGQSSQAMLEAGKRLILMKEHEPHGDWMDCLQKLNLDWSVAARMMKASLKFSDTKLATSPTLSKSKLIELMMLDDEEIQALDAGGTVAGLTLDEIDKMSTRELRAALRAEREETKADLAAKSATLAARDERISQLEEKLHKQKKPTPARAEEAALKALNDHTLLVVREIEVGMISMASELAREVGAESVDTLPERLLPAVQAAMMQIAKAARLTAAQMGVLLAYEDEVPEGLAWLDEEPAAKVAMFMEAETQPLEEGEFEIPAEGEK